MLSLCFTHVLHQQWRVQLMQYIPPAALLWGGSSLAAWSQGVEQNLSQHAQLLKTTQPATLTFCCAYISPQQRLLILTLAAFLATCCHARVIPIKLNFKAAYCIPMCSCLLYFNAHLLVSWAAECVPHVCDLMVVNEPAP